MPERPQRSSTYVELSRVHPTDQTWLGWLRDCGFPAQQVCHDGWVARDVRRNTVSAKIFLWKPDEEPSTEDYAAATIVRVDPHGHPTAECGVMTIQLDETPPPFPEPQLSREENEEIARSSLASLWRKLATVGDLTREDDERIVDYQGDIDRLSRLLDSIDRQRDDRRNAGDILRVGLTWTEPI